MTKTKTLTEGTPWKQILLFSIPIFWGNVFQLLYSLVDTKIVGSTLGTEASYIRFTRGYIQQWTDKRTNIII